MVKKTILVIFLCILLASFSWSHAEIEKDEEVIKQVEKLTKQVEMLEKRIKSLEKQIQSVDRMRIEIPKTFPKLQKLPKGWREHEFNGLTYYIVPLSNESKKK